MSWVAIGVGAASLIAGGVKAISGASKAKKAERAIDKLDTPTYTPNKSINDYYSAALERYSSSPYQSQQYKYGMQQGERSTAAGISALQDRRSAVGGISRLVALQNENALRQGVAAENQQSQNLGQLGAAAQVKAQDDRFGFEANEVMPYQKKLQLYGMKAGAGRQMEAAGWQDIGSGINTVGMGVSNGISSGWNNGGGGTSSLSQVNVTQGHPQWLDTYQDPGLTQVPAGGNQNSIFNYYQPQ